MIAMKKTGKRKSTIIVFCAHSDDQILGVGGTMVKYANEGKRIYTLIFSFGEATHPWLKRNVAAEMRAKESEAADKIIGGRGIRFLGLKEGRFSEEFEKKNMRSFVKSIIRKLKPEKIFTHSIDDPHPDHRAVHKLVLDTVDEMGYRCDIYAFDVWNPLKIRKRSEPRLYVDITDTFDTKMKALAQFRSQWLAMLALRWSVYIRAWINGIHNDCKYAESFVKVR
jgi:LmbE family N-acetylglucosaminyl deacetylase